MINYTSTNIRIWSRLGSCGAFGQAALALPEAEERTIILTADLCTFSGLDRFKVRFPDRLYNVGIAEQNMVGIAAGFAKEGFVPFATTYATFAVARSADQVKVNMGYMGLGVKLVGLTAGYSVGVLGPTHMCLEDLAFMRTLPHVVILSPADCTATVKATLAAAKIDAPVYLRLTGGMNNPIVYKEDFNFEVGKAIELREGSDVAIIATGSMVHYALKAAEQLEAAGVSASVLDMHTIKPLDTAAVEATCCKKLLVTVEEHSAIGGLGSAVAETLALKTKRPPHLIIGAEGSYPHAGDYASLLDICGLTPEKISEKIIETYKELF